MSGAFAPGRMRLVAFGILVATFLVGALAGAAVDRVLLADESQQVDRRDRRGDRGGRRHVIDQMDLAPDQRVAIDAILERRGERMRAVWSDMSPRLEAIADSTRAEIMEVLTPAQRAEYKAELERRRARREREEAARGGEAGRDEEKAGADGRGG